MWQWVLGWNKNFQYIAAVSSSADFAKLGGVGFGLGLMGKAGLCMCGVWLVSWALQSVGAWWLMAVPSAWVIVDLKLKVGLRQLYMLRLSQ